MSLMRHLMVVPILAVLPAVGAVSPAAASPVLLAEYTFEETQPSTQVLDQAGPDLSHGTAVDEENISYGTLQGSQALNVAANADHAIELGRGANDELNQVLTAGLHLEADFQLNEGFARGTLAALHASGTHYAWALGNFGETDASNSGRMVLLLSTDEGTGTVLVSPVLSAGTHYRVIASWTPEDGGVANLQVYDLSGAEPVLYGQTTQNVAGSSLSSVNSFYGVRIGSRSAGGLPFDGVIDNVRISKVPEPGSLGLLMLGGAAMLGRRRR